MPTYARYSGVGGGGGIQSINNSTVPAQQIVGGTAISVSTNIGTGITTITNTSPTVTTGNLTGDTNSTIAVTGGTNAVLGAGTSIAQSQASALSNGYLSSTDWSTFNSKQAALTIGNLTSTDITVSGGTGAVIGSGVTLSLTKGNLTESTSSVLTITGGTNCVLGSGTTIRVLQSSAVQSGYLSSTDWSTFNSKQNALSFGNLTGDTNANISISGGTGAVIGGGTSISQSAASATTNGYLTSTDWSTFNNKQPAGSYATTTLNNLGTTAINASLLFNPDATYDIGADGASRPAAIHASNHVTAPTIRARDNVAGAGQHDITVRAGNGVTGNKDGGVLTLQGGQKSGTGTDGYISVKTDSSERMRITAAGNVGIGTTTPSVVLDVVGSIKSSSDIQSISSNGGQLAGTRNRIINGAMEIDQRNSGAAVTLDINGVYTVDRFWGQENSDGVMTAQQVTDAPAGFKNSLKFTTTTADATIGSGQYVIAVQSIEGNNVTDLNWGTASAKQITLSFWVKSSLTGTFSGSLKNSAANRSYAFEYTINAANTWEQKSVTISGDTTGTWLTTNGLGIQVTWSLGVGSNFWGTLNTWAAGNFYGTLSTAVIGTLNATWFITGVQFEVGPVATSFEWRNYQQEFAMCQRYYETGSNYSLFSGYVVNGSIYYNPNRYSVTKRAVPGTVTLADVANSGFAAGAPTLNNNNADGFNVSKTSNATTNGGYFQYTWTSSAEL